MTTVVPGLIKIGKTGSSNFDQRMYNLEHNGYCNVTGLKRSFAIEVENYEDLHDLKSVTNAEPMKVTRIAQFMNNSIMVKIF